jgi:hypothetical protein
VWQEMATQQEHTCKKGPLGFQVAAELRSVPGREVGGLGPPAGVSGRQGHGSQG